MITVTEQDIPRVVREAKQAAYSAALKYFHEVLGGQDRFACGFAWVDIYGVKGNTKMGRAMKAAGIRKDWTGKAFQIWNPSEFGCQNIDTLEAGARAAAEVFKRYGFEAYAGSRLD